MTNLTTEAKQLQETLELKWPPISITFTNNPPTDIARINQRAPSGCTYWKLAAEGNVFYTEASDHFGCPIGAYTHGVELPPTEGKELEAMIEMMVGLSYLKMEDVPTIPRREDPFRFAIYAPLTSTPFAPDVVIIRGNAKQMMMLAEAANAAGISSSSRLMGRPTCAMIPAIIATQQSAMSLGCIGNRVYNELGDGEFYGVLHGSQVSSVIDKLKAVAHANYQLQSFHHDRSVQKPREDQRHGD